MRCALHKSSVSLSLELLLDGTMRTLRGKNEGRGDEEGKVGGGLGQELTTGFVRSVAKELSSRCCWVEKPGSYLPEAQFCALAEGRGAYGADYLWVLMSAPSCYPVTRICR